MKISFWRVIFLLNLVVFVLAFSGLPNNPICQSNEEEGHFLRDVNFEIEASVLLNNKLFLIVLDGQQKEHFVYDVSPSEISLSEPAIYLHYSKPMPMKVKWGFEPIELGVTIGTAFGLHSLQPANHSKPDNYIAFIYKQGGGHLLHLSTNELESTFEWNQNGSIVFGMDNEGYFFEWNKYWFAQECAFRGNKFELSQHKYFVLGNPKHRFFLFKKIGPRPEEQFLDWKRFSGFIYYNHVHLFSNHSVFLFEDSQEYTKVGFEYALGYRQYSYRQFFRCQRGQVEEAEDEEYGPHHMLRKYHEQSESTQLNLILVGLLIVVAISFCIRSQIMKNKSAQYKKNNYSKNRY